MGKEDEKPQAERTVRAQIVFSGDEFIRYFPVKSRKKIFLFPQTRRVRILGSLDEETGDVGFTPVRKVTGIYPSEFPHAHLSEANSMHNKRETEGKSLRTVRRRGASTWGRDVEADYRIRGATGKKIPKPPWSFMLGDTPTNLDRQSKRVKKEMREKEKTRKIISTRFKRRLIHLYEYNVSPN